MAVRFLSSENIDGVLTFSTTGTFGNNASITHYTNNYLYIRGGSAGLVVGDNTSATRALFSSSNFITWEINSGAAMHMDSSKRLGIGTSSPNHRLDIYSNENIPLRIHRPSNSNLNSAGAHGIGFSTRSDAVTSTTDTRSGIFSYYNGNLFFATNTSNIESDPDGSARMTILNTGYVGINTTNPLNQFDVRGAVYVTGYTIGFDTSPQGNYAYRFTNDGGNSFINARGGSLGVDTTSPVSKLEVQSSLNSTNFTGITVTNTEGSGSNLSRAGIAFKAYDWVQSAIWHGRNMSDGNQGALVLGTNPDTSDLTVGGVVGRMYIINNGNVGIGTPSPSDLLHLKKSSGDAALRIETVTGGDPTIYFNSSAANRSGLIRYQDNGTNMGRIEYVHNGDRIAFQAGSATGETMSIINGAVGIGTTSPSTKLEIQVSTNQNILRGHFGQSADIFLGFDQTNPRLLLQDNSNVTTHLFQANASNYIVNSNVGIGTTSPATTLDVRGSGEGVYIGRITASPHLRMQQFNGTVASPTATANGERVGQVSFEPRVSGGSFLEMCGIFGEVNGTVSSSAAPTDLVFAAGSSGAIASNEKMRITSSGNVGIGTDDGPGDVNAKVHIYKQAGDNTVQELLRLDCGENNHNVGKGGAIVFRDINVYTDTAKIIAQRRGNTGDSSLQFALRNSEIMRLKNSGDVIIGSDGINGSFGASNTVLAVKGSSSGGEGILQLTGLGNNATDIVSRIDFHSQAETDPMCSIRAVRGSADDIGTLTFLTNNGGSPNTNMKLDPSGNLGIGHVTVTDKLDVTTGASQYTGSFIYTGTNGSYGALRCTLTASNSPSFIDFFRTSYSSSSPVGAIVTGGSNVLYQSYSDYRLKENVEDLTGALDRVNNLQPKTFNYINAPEFTNEGFIAHELQEVVPQAVSGEKDGMNEDGTPKYQGVDNAHIVPLLVGAIKELKAEIENLKSQIQ